MKKTIQQISLTAFGSAAWLVCAVAMPMQQGTEQSGIAAAMVNLAVPAAYANGNGESTSAKTVSTCVSVAVLTESIGKDKNKEDGKAEDESKKAEDESKKAEDESKKAEDESKKANDDKAKEYKDKAEEHKAKAKEYEDKAKEHEAKAKIYADTSAKVGALQGNCQALVKIIGKSVSTEPGVWIPGTPEYVATQLAADGGATELINLISSDDGASVENKASDASMESYREIRGE